jgi:hypothetical protein
MEMQSAWMFPVCKIPVLRGHNISYQHLGNGFALRMMMRKIT